MVERFGYSLDVGKSLENKEESEDSIEVSDKKEHSKEESQKEESKEEPIVEEEVLEDDDQEELTGESISADNMKQDILDEIKEDIEIKPVSFDKVDSADELSEDLEDDQDVLDPSSAEAYSEDVIEVKIKPITDFDSKEGIEEEIEEEPARPPAPGEEDVTEMVEESFKEQARPVKAEPRQGRSLWRWGFGVLIIVILAFVVIKMGFIGTVDNAPSAAVVSDDDIDAELEAFFEGSEVMDDIVSEVEKEPVKETDLVPEPVDGLHMVPIEPEKEIEQEPEVIEEPAPIDTEKDTVDEQKKLLDTLMQGLN
jgi:hypothetical protein